MNGFWRLALPCHPGERRGPYFQRLVFMDPGVRRADTWVCQDEAGAPIRRSTTHHVFDGVAPAHESPSQSFGFGGTAMAQKATGFGSDRPTRGAAMTGRLGVLAAVLSSAVGGMNTAVTRFAIGATDPVTLAALRFGLGFMLLLPIALTLRSRWPQRRDWIGVVCLGILFFGIFMALFNLSLRYTTAARGALALATLPLMTMVVGAALRIEALTVRKTSGVLVAMAGV